MKVAGSEVLFDFRNIGDNYYDEFVDIVSNAEMAALNSEYGQEIVSRLRDDCLKENPNMTEAEWQQIKREFMAALFCVAIQNKPELMQEFGEHTYNKIMEEANDGENG
jgi:hypothetical protein